MENLTVQKLVDTITKNCPPNCPDRVVVSDNRFGEVGALQNVRYHHNGNGMVLELVFQGDLEDGK